MALGGKDRTDLCCRSLHKCDAHERVELNLTNVWPLWHCECVDSFYTCLNNLNTTISNEFVFIHSINTTKCFLNDHPIIKCNKFETYSDLQLFKLSNFDEREKYFKRCIKYELDQNRTEEMQIFDVTVNVNYATTRTSGKLSKTKQSFRKTFTILNVMEILMWQGNLKFTT